MVICPNLKNPDVAREFNELKNATSEAAAYHIWSLNNGNGIDKAPNGAESKLFLTLLEYYNGDRTKAIQAKAKTYGMSFLNWFGDWTGNASLVKYYGPTMGKTTAAKNNSKLVDFDDIVREEIKSLAEKKGLSVRLLKRQNPPEYKQLLLNAIQQWKESPESAGKTLLVSNVAISSEDIYSNTPSIPSRLEFIKRLVNRGERDESVAAQYYDDILSKWNPNLKIEDRYVSDIESISKVVDENGEPLLVYHGTRAKFTEFKKEFAKRPTRFGFYEADPELDKAFFFSSSKKYAGIRGDTIPAYLNIKNPFSKDTLDKMKKDHPEIIDDFEYDMLLHDFYGDDITDTVGDTFQMHTDIVGAAFSLDRKLGDGNVDGIIGVDIGETDHESDFAIKRPNQVKHIDNQGPTPYEGTFSTGDNNIMRQILRESDYISMLDELDLSRDKVENFIYNFYKKILHVNPRYKIDEAAVDFMWTASRGSLWRDYDRGDKLASKIFGYQVSLAWDGGESEFINSVEEELNNWANALLNKVNNPINMDDIYRERRLIIDHIELLNRYLSSSSTLSLEELNRIQQRIDGKKPLLIGYEILKLKRNLQECNDRIRILNYKRKSIIIAAKNRIVAINVINNLKLIVKDRLLAEYKSYFVKKSTIDEKLTPEILKLIDKLLEALNSSSKSRVSDKIIVVTKESLEDVSYDYLYKLIVDRFPQYKDLLFLFKQANPELKIKIGGNLELMLLGTVPGKYHPKTNTLYLFNGCDVYTAIHELGHSATFFGIFGYSDETDPFDSKIMLFMDYIRDYVKLNQLYSPDMFGSYNIMGVEIPANIYGFTNSSEFIAELYGNPQFQDLLDTIPPMESDKFKSLLQEIYDFVIDFLNKLFGNNKIHKTALDQAKELGAAAMRLQEIHIESIYNQLKEILQKTLSDLLFADQKYIYLKIEPTKSDYEAVAEMNGYDSSIKQYVSDEIAKNVQENKESDVLKVAQDAKRQWVEDQQKRILNDTQMQLAQAYGLRQEVGEDGRIRFVSDSTDERSLLIIDFLDYLSDEAEGYYDYNSKSTAAHHVIAISLTNGDPSTFSHELAHHYVRMFWNSRLIQTALRAVDKPGMTDEEREEALVDIITSQTNDTKFKSSIESQSFVQKFWAAFASMLYNVFGIDNAYTRNAIYRNVTKAFIMNERLRITNSQNYIFLMADLRMFKRSTKYKKRLRKAREEAHANRSAVAYETVGNNKIQTAIKSIVQGSVSRNKQYRRTNIQDSRTLVQMQIAEDNVRRFVEDIEKYRQQYINSIQGKPTKSQLNQRANTPEEISANIDLIRGFLDQAESELQDLSQKFKSIMENNYAGYISKEVVNPSTGEVAIEYLDPSLINDPDATETIIDFKEISEIKQNVIGFYDRVIKDLHAAIMEPSFGDIYGKDVQTEILSRLTSINAVATSGVHLNDIVTHLDVCYTSIITEKLRNFVRKYITENTTNLSDDQRESLIYSTNTWLENQNAFGDIGITETWLGLASNSKSSLIRIMLDMIDDMDQKKRDIVNEKGFDLRQLRKSAMSAMNKRFAKDDLKLYGALSVYNIDKLLMEEDDDGFTGNFVSPVNEGKYYKDRSKFIDNLLFKKGGIEDRLRANLGDKEYELEIDSNGEPVFPEGLDALEKEYLHELNKWTGTHAVRRFTVAYYDKRIDMLSSTTRRAQTQIQNLINDIIRACTIDGQVHTELLNPTQMLDLQKLYYRKSQLSNPFDMYGAVKPDGSEEALIAKELTEWNLWQSEHIKNKMDYDAFEAAKAGAKNKDKFERDNTYRTINPEIWEEIKRIVPSTSSKQMDELRQTRAKLISIIKMRGLVNPSIDTVIDRNTGKIRPGYEEFWNNLRKYDTQIEALKASTKSSWTKALVMAYKALMTQLPIEIDLPGGVSMSWYSFIAKQIKQRLIATYGKNDPRVDSELLQEMKQFLWAVRGSSGQLAKQGKLSIFFLTQPPAVQVSTSKGLINSVVREPIQAYSVIDVENSDPDYVDTRFDAKSGKPVQPITDETRRNADDVSYTSEKYKKYIENGPEELKKYYNGLISTMTECYENIPFVDKYDNRLPQQGASTGQMFHRNKWWDIRKPLAYWFKRTFTINERDTDINVDYELRPDGTRSMNIPIRYIKRLDDSNEINSDVLGSVIDFYEMSQNYKMKSEKLPLFLTAIDKLQSSNNNRPRQKQFLKGIVNRQFYDRIRNMDTGEDNLTSYANKLARGMLKWIPGFRLLTTTGLLALNWLAGTVAYIDPAIQILVDAISGRYIDMYDYLEGTGKMLYRLPLALASAGKSTSYDLISAGMTRFGLATSGSYNFRHMDRSLIRRFLLDGLLMLPFHLGEHTVNAQVYSTVMCSYKYVYDDVTKKGLYMNKREYYDWAQERGIPIRTAKIRFRMLPKLFDAYTIDKKGNMVPKDNEYGKAVTPELENQVGKRMRNRATVSNLIVPGTERTKIQSNILTAFTVVMRTFMLVGLSERFRSLHDFQVPDDSIVDENTQTKIAQRYNRDYFYQKGGYNFLTGEIEDGVYAGFFHALGISQTIGYLWLVIKQHTFKPKNAEDPTQFVNAVKYGIYSLIHPLRSRYNSKSEEKRELYQVNESDIYAFNRVITELLVFGFLAMLQTVFHNKMVDDGNDDKYWYQVADHLLIRTALVRLTWFSPDTFMDLINSITPSKSDIDKKVKLYDLIKDAYQGFKQHGRHFEDWEKVRTGGYKNAPKAFRDLLQTFSSLGLHSLYTSSNIEGVKAKTKWFKKMVIWRGYWHEANSSKNKGGNIQTLPRSSKPKNASKMAGLL